MLRSALLTLCALAPATVLAAPAAPDPAQAQALQQQLRGWLADTIGAPAPAGAIGVAAEGDHYRVTLDAATLPALSAPDGLRLSAQARPLEGGRWAVDDIRLPSPARFRVAAPAGRPGKDGPVDVALTLEAQDTRAVLDPGFATPSTLTSTLRGYDATTTRGDARQHQHLDASATHASLLPAAGGRVDLTTDGTAENYSMTQSVGARPPFELAARQLHGTLHLDGLEPARVPPALRALFHPAPPSEEATTPAARRAELRALYLAWRGLAAGGEVTETLDGVRVAAGGRIVGLDRISLGLGAASTGETLAAHLSLALDGLRADGLPEGARALLPHHLAIRPSLSALRLRDLDALILALTAPPEDHADAAGPFATLFAQGGVGFGLDLLEFDLGPANFTGTGKLTVLSPERTEGQAQLTATGFDALLTQAQDTPDLARAVPVLVMMRGLARADGQRLVWNLASRGGAVTVNGVDLSAMLGRGKRHAPAAPNGRSR